MPNKEFSMALFHLADSCAEFLVETEALERFVVDPDKSRLEALLFCLEVVEKVFSPSVEGYQQVVGESQRLLLYMKCTEKRYSIMRAEKRRDMHRSEIEQLLNNENYMGAKSAFHIYRAPLEAEQELEYILDQKAMVRLCLVFRAALGGVMSMMSGAKEMLEKQSG